MYEDEKEDIDKNYPLSKYKHSKSRRKFNSQIFKGLKKQTLFYWVLNIGS